MRARVGLEEGNSGFWTVGSKGFLQSLSPVALEAFETIRLTTTYPPGSVLFMEGDTARGVYVLSKGGVKLSIASASGKVMILRIAKPGEILGLHAVVSSTDFQATAETVEPCEVSFVRQEDFLRLLREHPEAAIEAAKQLSSSYQEACGQLRALGLSHSAREKVARFVLDWSEDGQQKKEGIRTTLTLTHEEIGQLIGVSRETVSRVLSHFRSRRWITIKGSTLWVQNKAALQGILGESLASPTDGRLRQSRETSAVRSYQGPSRWPLGRTEVYSAGIPASLGA